MFSSLKYSVLLVDDDPTCNFLNSRVINRSDAFNPPLAYSNPQEALDYLLQHCLKNKQVPLPELMLIDINMPVLDGFEFVEELNNLCPDILNKTLLYFLSSSYNIKDQSRAKSLGVDSFYQKPLKTENIAEIITYLQR